MGGNANSGRRKDVDEKVGTFKRVAWDLIVRRCTLGAGPKSAEQWIEHYTQMFANKMMPQIIEGSGPDGEFEVKEIHSEEELKLYEQFRMQAIKGNVRNIADAKPVDLDNGQSDKDEQGNSV